MLYALVHCYSCDFSAFSHVILHPINCYCLFNNLLSFIQPANHRHSSNQSLLSTHPINHLPFIKGINCLLFIKVTNPHHPSQYIHVTNKFISIHKHRMSSMQPLSVFASTTVTITDDRVVYTMFDRSSRGKSSSIAKMGLVGEISVKNRDSAARVVAKAS